MRRPATATLTAALLAATLALTACSGDSGEPDDAATGTDSTASPDGTASPADVAALEAVTVDGETGAVPTVDFDAPFDVSNAVARLDVEGSGPALEAGQHILMDYVAVSGEGDVLGSTWELGSPELITLGDPQVFPALTDALAGQQVGARVLFAAPGTEAMEATETTPAQEALPATLMAIEVVEVVPPRAEGEAVAPPAGLPTVALADQGAPSIEVPADAAEPVELVAQTLIEGGGATVETGQQLAVHYSGWLWDGTPFDSSWERTPLMTPFVTPIGAGRVVAGWDEGLVGKTVGSQVLLVVPADKGYGETGQGSIPPGATLIFVVDILAAS